MKKRGISPLIATVLLIGFTIALAVIITNWGLDYVKKTTDRTSEQTEHALGCINNLDFDIKEVVCEDNRIVIDNKGTSDITTITFRIHNGGDVIPVLARGIPAFGVRTYDGTNPETEEEGFDLTDATQVDAIATITDRDGNEVICSQVVKERRVTCGAEEEEEPPA
ncbi:MAG: hypothetical protein Q7R96_00035 [Nanoarchaeota archaeon]|nr:hypothetical protein [Nanoarchaeota archaeon]